MFTAGGTLPRDGTPEYAVLVVSHCLVPSALVKGRVDLMQTDLVQATTSVKAERGREQYFLH